MDWTTGVSGLSLKDWRVCYAEHNRNEQVLLHQELYGYAMQVQQDYSSDPASAWKRAAERRSVHSDVKEPQTCSSVLVRQNLFHSLRETLCTGISVYVGTCLRSIYKECDLRKSPQMGSGHGDDRKTS